MSIPIKQIVDQVVPAVVKRFSTREKYVDLLEELGETPVGENENALHDMIMSAAKFEQAVEADIARELEGRWEAKYGQLDMADLNSQINPSVLEETGYSLEFALVDLLKTAVRQRLVAALVRVSEDVHRESLSADELPA